MASGEAQVSDFCLTHKYSAAARQIYGNADFRAPRSKRVRWAVARFFRRLFFVMQPASRLKTKTITKR